MKKSTEHFDIVAEDDIPLIRANAQQLEQVVINLIMNALQSLQSRDRGVRVPSSYDKDRNSVIMTVQDEAIGIHAAQLDRIREPFFITRLESGGTGLGLSVSYAIVKDHGGLLEFSSSPGTGTASGRVDRMDTDFLQDAI